MKKIALLHIPPALAAALTEQLDGRCTTAIQGESAIKDWAPDLIITTTPFAATGIPVLLLKEKPPQRLGSILRQITQMLAAPELYLDDLAIGAYIFKPQERCLTLQGKDDIALTDRETGILAHLARHSPQAVTREDLLKHVWQYQEGLDTHTLETHIYRLRQKMEEDAENPQLLRTTEGGYALHLPNSAV